MTESRYVLENERLQNPPCEDLDEIFFHLSNDSKGLEAIENPLILKDLAQSRNNIDCVIYTFKFISEKEVFFDIMENNAEDFKNFDEKERKSDIGKEIVIIYENEEVRRKYKDNEARAWIKLLQDAFKK